MKVSLSKLFQASGYISLYAYITDIGEMQKKGPWKLPLGLGDRWQFFLLKLLAKFSWFAEHISLRYPYPWSPAYSILITHLKRARFIDEVFEKNSYFSKYFFFSFKKSIFINEFDKPLIGFGVDTDIATAFSKAMGEIIERFVSGLYNKDKDILIASPQELLQKAAVFYPPRFHRFLAIQQQSYRELEYHPSNKMDWMSGMNIITKKKTYIPRHIVSWFGFAEARTFRDILLHPTSNGCAGYFTKTGAVLRGLLEVVQRDAFLVHWLTQIAPNVITGNTLPEGVQQMIREFRSRGISLYILDISALSIPSIAIVAINQDAEMPQVVLSGASAITFEQAIGDAMREMVLMSAYMFYKGDNAHEHEHASSSDEFKPFISDLNENTRQLFWRSSERIKQFEWFLSGKEVSYDEIKQKNLSSKPDDASRLKTCLTLLKERGPDYYPIVYFPKHPIQKKLGFYVAQVYIPKAFPLYLLECQGTFDSDRLQEFAESKGVKEWELNRMPHMFS